MEIKNSKGKVWLVGGGPGDAELLTLKGKRLIETADVIVYDRLVGDSILSMIPDHIKMIDVGKCAGYHKVRQDNINEILVQEAKKGQNVVRLKGGDPFLFGRGGEELERLVEENIPFEIVPGITSAISVPAYNGIPVTHRDYCSSLHIITGHKKAGVPYNLSFEALVNTKGTLVFLMGLGALKDICDGLISAGMDENMPVAVLQQGTTANQKRVVATLATIQKRVLQARIQTPAIIVVGEVCTLAAQFEWYEKMPLSGCKVIVTRPQELKSVMVEKLRISGAEVIEMPSIKVELPEDQSEIIRCLKKLADYQYLVFTSPSGVRLFFEVLLSQNMDIRKLGHCQIAAIGSGTAKELRKNGIIADLIPDVYTGEALGKMLALECTEHAHILIPRAAIGNHELIEALSVRTDLDITDLSLYQTKYTHKPTLEIFEQIESNQIDYVLFTSASTVKGFVESLGNERDYQMIQAVCIGQQTARMASQYGMQIHISDTASIDSMIDLLIRLNEKKKYHY